MSSVAGPPSPGYLNRSWPIQLIFLAFFVLTVPLCGLAYFYQDTPQQDALWFMVVFVVYILLLATTHFVLTLTIYLQSENLRFFRSTRWNCFLYFVFPVLIFALFDFYRAFEIATLFPFFNVCFRAAIRLLDFNHFGRQNYGVLQMLKARSRQRFPSWMRRAETLFFLTFSALILITYFHGGRFRADCPFTLITVGMTALLGLWVSAGFWQVWRQTGQFASMRTPLAYFAMQTVAMALAAYWNGFYFACLAMHYVEYHVLMAPRCFETPLHPDHAIDRIYGALRRSKIVFYGVVVLAAAGFTFLNRESMRTAVSEFMSGSNTSYLMLIALFDGLFVFHYIIETVIWKFSEPHYRQILAPIYFGPPPAQPNAV